MKFILLSLNMVAMLLLGMYLLNIFSIDTYGVNGIILLFVLSMSMVLIADSIIKEFKISNPLFFILPGLAAVIVSVMVLRQLSILTALSILFLVPGVVMFIRKK